MDKVSSKINALVKMDIAELKALWHKYFDYKPPKYDREYMTRRIAYHIQALAYGGLSKSAKNKLDRLAFGGQSTVQDKYRLRPGTRLIKDYKGQRLMVSVREDGFEYDGRLFKTLTMIAREITGNPISGPAFFGVKGSKNG